MELLIVTIILLTSSMMEVECLRCFQCSSFQNPECADIKANDTTSPFLQDCRPIEGHDQIFCRKTYQKLLDPKTDVTRITRSCGWFVHKRNVSNCRKADTDFRLETSCQCFTEACNLGHSVQSGVVLVLIALLATLFLYT